MSCVHIGTLAQRNTRVTSSSTAARCVRSKGSWHSSESTGGGGCIAAVPSTIATAPLAETAVGSLTFGAPGRCIGNAVRTIHCAAPDARQIPIVSISGGARTNHAAWKSRMHAATHSSAASSKSFSLLAAVKALLAADRSSFASRYGARPSLRTFVLTDSRPGREFGSREPASPLVPAMAARAELAEKARSPKARRSASRSAATESNRCARSARRTPRCNSA